MDLHPIPSRGGQSFVICQKRFVVVLEAIRARHDVQDPNRFHGGGVQSLLTGYEVWCRSRFKMINHKGILYHDNLFLNNYVLVLCTLCNSKYFYLLVLPIYMFLNQLPPVIQIIKNPRNKL